MPLSGAAPSAGTRATRNESLTAVPGRIHGVAVWRKRDSELTLNRAASDATRAANTCVVCGNPYRGSAVRVELDDSAELVRLRDYLRGFGCFAFVGGNSLDVYPPETTTEKEERALIRTWLEVWNKGNGSQARLSQ